MSKEHMLDDVVYDRLEFYLAKVIKTNEDKVHEALFNLWLEAYERGYDDGYRDAKCGVNGNGV